MNSVVTEIDSDYCLDINCDFLSSSPILTLGEMKWTNQMNNKRLMISFQVVKNQINIFDILLDDISYSGDPCFPMARAQKNEPVFTFESSFCWSFLYKNSFLM